MHTNQDVNPRSSRHGNVNVFTADVLILFSKKRILKEKARKCNVRGFARPNFSCGTSKCFESHSRKSVAVKVQRNDEWCVTRRELQPTCESIHSHARHINFSRNPHTFNRTSKSSPMVRFPDVLPFDGTAS